MATTAKQKIQHFVILMMENRSFDHIFGFRKGVNGLKGSESNLPDPSKPEGPSNRAIHVGTGAPYAISLGEGPGHSLNQTTTQLFGSKDAAGKPSNDGFVKAYHSELTGPGDRVSNPSEADLSVCMQSFDPSRLPAINQLADEFCICDQWFAEVPGPTQPNRLYLHAATSGGHALNAWSLHFDFKTIYGQVQKAGLTWATYEHDTNEVRWFTEIEHQTKNFKKIDEFAADVKAGTLANYVFIAPRMLSGKNHEIVNSQHAPHDIRYGEHLIADVYDALRSNPVVWERSALIVLYDEHGGFYDHVAPPPAVNPDGLDSPTPKDPHYAPEFKFDRLGLRVAAVIASPWIDKGTVYSKQLQHTSIMQTARRMLGMSRDTLTKRDAKAAPFDDVFARSTVRTDTPLKLKRPALPNQPSNKDAQHPSKQPLDRLQHSIVMGVNHATRNTVENPPAELLPRTQGAASKFVIDRIRRHSNKVRASTSRHSEKVSA